MHMYIHMCVCMHHALWDGLLVGAHEVGEGAQQVGEEGERLDLRRHEVCRRLEVHTQRR